MFSSECRRVLEYRGRKAEIVCVCPQQDGWVRRLSQLCTFERPFESLVHELRRARRRVTSTLSAQRLVSPRRVLSGPLCSTALTQSRYSYISATVTESHHIIYTVPQTHAEWVWANLQVWPTGRNTKLASKGWADTVLQGPLSFRMVLLYSYFHWSLRCHGRCMYQNVCVGWWFNILILRRSRKSELSEGAVAWDRSVKWQDASLWQDCAAAETLREKPPFESPLVSQQTCRGASMTRSQPCNSISHVCCFYYYRAMDFLNVPIWLIK